MSHLSFIWIDLLKVGRRGPTEGVGGDLSLPVHKHTFCISDFFGLIFVVSPRHTYTTTYTHACTLRQRHIRGQSSPSVITLD